METKLTRLQIYSAILSSIIAFTVYVGICYAFTEIDLLETIVTFLCFVFPLVVSIPFYMTED